MTIASIGGASRSMISESDTAWDFIDKSIFSREEFAEATAQDDGSEVSGELSGLPPTCLDNCVEVLRHSAAFEPKQELPQQPPLPRPDSHVQPRTFQPAVQTIPPSTSIPIRKSERIPRNAKCPCGSGKKYKQCCLR